MTGANKVDEAEQSDPPGIVRVDRPVRPLFRGRDCACQTDSALHCAWLRYGDTGEDCCDEPNERCECRCHEQDDYDD
ncbi:MAG: hypothetical protein CAPSK01_004529 [Candidatus Accumulibacter vicinus]|jgi:hypothetical protein|uniref:Uncharacterized protein n=1 Tax=Candidatus Accumulibacter vicinus TaxID=2954382 RepID=A0A084XUL6_9PROT|nr:MAG: hypothetical protein CAPSK01_004529 [Candidatus Accumulibacter vicinus]